MKLFSFLLTFSCLLSTFAQLELPEDKVSTTFRVEQNGCEATIIAKSTVVPEWHINAVVLPPESFMLPTTLILEESENFDLKGKVIEPKPHHFFDELADEHLYYHEGTFEIKQKIKVNSSSAFQLKGGFEFQTCNDVKCLPNHTYEFNLKIKGCKSEAAVIPAKKEKVEIVKNDQATKEVQETSQVQDDSSSEEVKDGGESDVEAKNEEPEEDDDEDEDPVSVDDAEQNDSGAIGDKGLWTIFLLSFASGLAALLTPCVFPMIPMTVSFFTKQSKSKAQGIKNASIYGVSIIVIYILLGTLVTGIFGADVLNEMSTNPWFNIIFFLVLVIFAISFLGAFEIQLPTSWANKVDRQADRGGMIGIFFMALALAIISFSCTGPIVGTLLVEAASKGGMAPLIGMFGFSLALALPFALFAAFPGWMNSLPQSGGWLNTVKVVLGFLELALAFKFLSNADLAWQGHWLERELFLAIWIAVFGVLSMYLFGWIKMPHDSPLEKLSVGRALFGTFTLAFVLYMVPGLFGAPLKLISAFPPPKHYSESPLGIGGGGNTAIAEEHVDGMHLGPQNIMMFEDYDKAKAYAQKVGKPLFVDFTGWNCVNCRRMEESVWGEPGILEVLQNDVVIASLHVDEKIDLPADEVREVELTPGRMKTLKTIGDKWMYKQISEYKIAAQPYYVMQTPNGEDLGNGGADYEHHSNPKDFKKWLNEGMKRFKEKK